MQVFRSPVAIVLTLLIAITGVYVVYRSQAAVVGYNDYTLVTVIDQRTGAPVPGVDIRFRSYDDQRYCYTPYQPTNAYGQTLFDNCQLGLYNAAGLPADYYYFYYVSAPGYNLVSPSGNSSYNYYIQGGQEYITFYVRSPDPAPPPPPPPPSPTPPPPAPAPSPPPPAEPPPSPTPPPPAPAPAPAPSPSPGTVFKPKPAAPPRVSQSQVAAIQVTPGTELALEKEADQALELLTTANVKKGETSTITSDDGSVSATFESGTFEVDAECVIVTEEPIEGLTYGPYKIACQDKDGNELTTFGVAVTLVFTLPEGEQAQWHDFVTLDGQSRSVLESTKSEDTRTLTAKLETPMIFGVVKNAQSNTMLYGWIAGGVILLILAGAAVWFIRRRQGGQDNFDDYIRSQYVRSGASGHIATAPAGPSIDPGQRAGMSVHVPGTLAGEAGETHATAEHTALQQAQERLAQLQDPTPPTPGTVMDGEFASKPGANPTNRPE